MKYLLVVDCLPTEKMEWRLWSMLEKEGIQKEACELMPLVKKVTGKFGKITQKQITELMPGFRSALYYKKAEVVIPLGGAPFRAITGLSGKAWHSSKIIGYILEPSDCARIPMKDVVEIGMYVRPTRNSTARQGIPNMVYALSPKTLCCPRAAATSSQVCPLSY